MKIEQYVMAYRVEQDRLRAFMPEEYESLRPVLRINAEIRSGKEESVYVEFNTPVAAFGKRGWLNIANWESPITDISYRKDGKATTFISPFLKITYTGVGIEGGCPAEKDNDGCFFIGDKTEFREKEIIDVNKEFCDCEFEWTFAEGNAKGISVGDKTVAVEPTAKEKAYDRQELSAETAAAIACKQIAGAYVVKFNR
ncbi:hypothetical protein SDC9_180547 [bioreactor metagenome]|uniref:Uncharacterized protein n=1 Tax=bioreactor metagenome TaxID=1076179 RepID=A0A645HAD2_9ZZZZ